MRFRFTIRDMLWLVVVAALAAGWSIEELRLNKEIELRQAASEKRIYEVRHSISGEGRHIGRNSPAVSELRRMHKADVELIKSWGKK